MIQRDEIHQRISEAMPDAQILIQDLTGGGDHFQVVVVSDAFRGISQLKRHRMVYDTMRDILGGALHALALKTLTHEEMPQEHAPSTGPTSLRSL